MISPRPESVSIARLTCAIAPLVIVISAGSIRDQARQINPREKK